MHDLYAHQFRSWKKKFFLLTRFHYYSKSSFPSVTVVELYADLVVG